MKVSVIVLIYNSRKFIKPVFDAILAQTHKDLEVLAVINRSDDGSLEMLQQNYPLVKLLEPGGNLWFSKGNNLAIANAAGVFIQLVNHDLILEPNYVEELLKVFANPRVAAATGKLLRYDFQKMEKTNIIDSTGIVMSASGRARDRGQNQIDISQFDKFQNPNDKFQIVFGVTGAGPMYRKSAMGEVEYCENSHCEIFDEDFFAYWEDVDLSWRLDNIGFTNVYVPTALAYHGRTAGQSQGGYKNILGFIRHHKQLSPQILKLNYKNHILMYIKNAKHIWHPAFILREIAMLGYIFVFETSTLKVLPELFRQIPKIWAKRKAART